jgi:hypothetical protein
VSAVSVKRGLPVLLGLAVCAATLAASTVVGDAAPVSCNRAVAQVDAGAPGPITCRNGGVPNVLASKGTPLALKTITVTVLSVRVVPNAFEPYPGVALKKSTYVAVKVRVTNTTRTPRQFNPVGMTELEIRDFDYDPAWPVAGDPAVLTLGIGPYVMPGRPLVGDIVFNIFKSDLGAFPAHAGFAFVNFGQSTASGPVSQIGVVVLGRGGV